MCPFGLVGYVLDRQNWLSIGHTGQWSLAAKNPVPFLLEGNPGGKLSSTSHIEARGAETSLLDAIECEHVTQD